MVVSSGEALTIGLALRMVKLFPNAVLLNLYGATETIADGALAARPAKAQRRGRTVVP